MPDLWAFLRAPHQLVLAETGLMRIHGFFHDGLPVQTVISRPGAGRSTQNHKGSQNSLSHHAADRGFPIVVLKYRAGKDWHFYSPVSLLLSSI
ncbi:Hypothetical protein GbCGDNIH9_1588 [Granulibacter bethesdensis]|uniref:Uncharacterized protein n=1 Tax=Granulibacter bethesdensis TaxID=364410 RepID=A0AAC9KBL5_9PROT|nr:Hypothetical protein GbCGDNIH9_1588 [Granulibacter bethesdensis]APH62465.1 Hypothetical protein GbCGDNIH8_1588 [Granulibacter bethesdensis]